MLTIGKLYTKSSNQSNVYQGREQYWKIKKCLYLSSSNKYLVLRIH